MSCEEPVFTAQTLSAAMRPTGRMTTDEREMGRSSRSTTPHTQEFLQAESRVGGIHRRRATLKRADIQRNVIGNGVLGHTLKKPAFLHSQIMNWK